MNEQSTEEKHSFEKGTVFWNLLFVVAMGALLIFYLPSKEEFKLEIKEFKIEISNIIDDASLTVAEAKKINKTLATKLSSDDYKFIKITNEGATYFRAAESGDE